MKLPALLSSGAAGICLVLSIWLFVTSSQNQALQAQLQKQQQELQTQSQEMQMQQQQLQAQQEQITAGAQLAKEVGPAVLRDMGTSVVQNKNEKMKTLLAKYGVAVQEGAAPDASKPAPKATP